MADEPFDGIEIVREIPATQQAVFDALVLPEAFSQWFGGSAVEVPLETLNYVAEPGRSWSATMVLPDANRIQWAGEFVRVVPPHAVEMTLTDRPDDPERAPLFFGVVASPVGSSLTMRQVTPGFSEEQKQATMAGWNTFIDVIAEIAQS